MGTKAFQGILCFLVLLGTAHASDPVTECTAQAWVRAPDLTPDTIIQGDARVKISAGCPAVDEVSLGLRLKERSVVKALRSEEDRRRMYSTRNILHPPPDLNRLTPWDFPWRHPHHCDETRYHERLANKDLWVVREEERLVFETTQAIPLAEGARQGHDVVHDFAVLVPSTNFPPALDGMNTMSFASFNTEVVNGELAYEYFVRVPFANGTTKEILAGITAFQPLYDPADSLQWSSSGVVELESGRFGVSEESPLLTTYSAEVSGSPSAFAEGSEDQTVTVMITRTGPARTFAAPFTLHGYIDPFLSSKWAVEYGTRVSQSMRNPGHILNKLPPIRADLLARS